MNRRYLWTWYVVASLGGQGCGAGGPEEELGSETAAAQTNESLAVHEAQIRRAPDWSIETPAQGNVAWSLAIDHFMPSVVYTAGVSLWSSWSLGARWHLNEASDFGTVLSDPNLPGVAYASLGNGPEALLVTRNAGVTWRQESSPRLVAVAPGDSDVRWANRAWELLKSVDGGVTWQQVALPGRCCGPVVALSSQDIFVNSSHEHVLRSSDGGATWVVRSPSDLQQIAQVAVDLRHPEIVYASSFANPEMPGLAGLRKSIDGGRTWFAPNARFSAAPISWVAVSPVDGQVYIVEFVRTPTFETRSVFVSVDGGRNFVPAGEGLGDAWTGQIIPHPRLPCVAFALTERAVYRTLNGGGACSRR